MTEPFLYGVIASLISKLESSNLANNLKIPFDGIEELKRKLILLPSALPVVESDFHPTNNASYFANLLDEGWFPSDLLPENRFSWLCGEVKKDLYHADDLLDGGEAPSEIAKFLFNLNKKLTFLTSVQGISKGISFPLSEYLPEKLEWPDVCIVSCLAYCALYSKYQKIFRETLVNQWMAEGFLLPTADEEPEDVGNRYFNELLSRGVFEAPIFVFDSNQVYNSQSAIYSCKMNSLAHDAISRIAAKDVARDDLDFLPNNPSALPRYYNIWREYKEFSSDTYLRSLVDPMARTLTIFNATSNAFDQNNLKHLRVLNITKFDFKKQNNEILSVSKHLRYLDLRGIYFKVDSNSEDFEYLQTLDLNCITLEDLIRGRELRNLRNLYLTSKDTKVNLSGFTALRILELSYCSDLICLSGVKDLNHLRKLHIKDCPNFVSLPSDMECLTRIEELILHNCLRLHIHNGMKELPKLRHLELIGLHNMVELPVWLAYATALQYLMIANCNSLRRLTIHVPSHDEAKKTIDVLEILTSLRKLFIYACPRLRAEPKPNTSLQSLHIKGCRKLIQNYRIKGNNNWAHIPNLVLQLGCYQDQDCKDYGLFGYDEGQTWSVLFNRHDKIRGVRIRSDNYGIHRIGFVVDDAFGSTKTFRGSLGYRVEDYLIKVELNFDEYITQIIGTYGPCNKQVYDQQARSKGLLRSLRIHTNLCTTGYGPYGTTSNINHIKTFETPILQVGDVITKIHGRMDWVGDDIYLTSIGMHAIVRKEHVSHKPSSSQTNSYSATTLPFYDWNGPISINNKDIAHRYSHDEFNQHSKWDILAGVLESIVRMKALVLRRRLIKMDEELLEEPKLLCSLFPRDYEFERDTIVQLWMAGGFLKNVHKFNRKALHVEERFLRNVNMDEGFEDAGYTYFDVLLNQNYLLKPKLDFFTGKDRYKVNLDKVTDFLNTNPMFKANEIESQPEEMKAVSDASGKCRHVSLTGHMDELPFKALQKLDGLKTLLFIHNYGSVRKVPSGLFVSLKCLRALDLSGSHINQLPSSIEYMTELRYLDLSYTHIEQLSDSVECLVRLQSLILRGCKHLFELPKGMNKLIRLRHLDFDVFGQLAYMPKGFGALKELRTLSAFIVDNRDGCNIMELTNLNNLTGSFCLSGLENVSTSEKLHSVLSSKTHLTQLELKWDHDKSKVSEDNSLVNYEDMKPHASLEKLQISSYRGSQLPSWMGDKGFMNLVHISLYSCEIAGELNISLGELPQLKHLDIVQMNTVTEFSSPFHASAEDADFVAFPKLETFKINSMLELEIWKGTEKWDYPCLSTLVIKQCPELAELPFLPNLQSLKHLEISRCKKLDKLVTPASSMESLIINHCPLLNKRFSKGGEEWDKIEQVQEILIDLQDPRTVDKDIQPSDVDTSEDDSITTDNSEDDSITTGKNNLDDSED